MTFLRTMVEDLEGVRLDRGNPRGDNQSKNIGFAPEPWLRIALGFKESSHARWSWSPSEEMLDSSRIPIVGICRCPERPDCRAQQPVMQ